MLRESPRRTSHAVALASYALRPALGAEGAERGSFGRREFAGAAGVAECLPLLLLELAKVALQAGCGGRGRVPSGIAFLAFVGSGAIRISSRIAIRAA